MSSIIIDHQILNKLLKYESIFKHYGIDEQSPFEYRENQRNSEMNDNLKRENILERNENNKEKKINAKTNGKKSKKMTAKNSPVKPKHSRQPEKKVCPKYH
jgi:hypothetical protein